jgi:hypothetical protein
MRIIQIPKKMTISSCESFLSEIHEGEEEITLQIPTNSQYSAAGGEVSFVQAITTWAQRQTQKNLITYAKDEQDQQLAKIPLQLFGLAAGLNADRVEDSSGRSITAKLRGNCLDQIRKLHGPSPEEHSKGQQLQILCLDHLGLSTPSLLYIDSGTGPKRLGKRSEFDYASSLIFRLLIKTQFDRKWVSEAIDAFAAIFYEIFNNTEEHALRDLDRNRLMNSTRGIHARHHSLLPETLAKIVSGYAPLDSYCSKLKPSDNKKQISFIELSILDSGPGFAPTWLRLPLSHISLSDEIKAINECFTQNRSSKPYDGFGQGLPLVANLLSKLKGFIRLRTGRQSLYYDFFSDEPFSDTFRLRQICDTDTGSFAPVTGSLVTIIIPLQQII